MFKVTIALLLASVLTLIVTVKPVEAQHCPDFDHDGVVTETDVYAVVDRFGTYKGGPALSSGIRYSGWFDLNHDGRVDLSDILRAISLVGQKCY